MKRVLRISIYLVMVFSMLGFAFGCAKPAPAPAPAPVEPIEIFFNSWVGNEAHPLYVKIQKPFAEELERRTDGRVKVTIHIASALTKTATAHDAVVTGVAEMSGVIPAQDKARYPLASLASLPFIYSSGRQAAASLQDLRMKYPQFDEEFTDVKVLWVGCNDVFNYYSTEAEPVKSIDDIKGKLVGDHGPATPAIVLLGANPIKVTGAERYGMAEKGVYDAMMGNLGWFKSGHMDEVIKSITLLGFMSTSHVYLMNLDVFNSMTPGDQKILDELSQEMAAKYSDVFDGSAAETIQWLKTDHPEITIYTPTDEERQGFADAVSPLWEEWVSTVEGLGYPGRDMLNDFIAFNQKHK